MTSLFHTIERTWPDTTNNRHRFTPGKGIVEDHNVQQDGPVSVLAPNHQPYQATIWERITREERRGVLRLLAELKS